jgi:hypothetical protein
MSYNNLYSTLNYNSSNESDTTTINNYYNNKQLIKVDTINNYNINVTSTDYTQIYEYFIVNCKDIYLPIVDNDLLIGFTIKILNATSKLLNIYSQNNQLIYNNFYLPKGGSNILLQTNSQFVFCVIKKNTFFSWIMV